MSILGDVVSVFTGPVDAVLDTVGLDLDLGNVASGIVDLGVSQIGNAVEAGGRLMSGDFSGAAESIMKSPGDAIDFVNNSGLGPLVAVGADMIIPGSGALVQAGLNFFGGSEDDEPRVMIEPWLLDPSDPGYKPYPYAQDGGGFSNPGVPGGEWANSDWGPGTIPGPAPAPGWNPGDPTGSTGSNPTYGYPGQTSTMSDPNARFVEIIRDLASSLGVSAESSLRLVRSMVALMDPGIQAIVADRLDDINQLRAIGAMR